MPNRELRDDASSHICERGAAATAWRGKAPGAGAGAGANRSGPLNVGAVTGEPGDDSLSEDA